jgi:hypothetical protein
VKALLCLIAGASLAGTLIAHCSCLLPGGKGGGPYRGRSLSEVLDQWARERERRERLDSASQQVRRRVEHRDATTRQLIAGRLSLLSAAAVYRELMAELLPFDWERFREQYPDIPDDERFCRAVIDYAAILLEERPAERAAVVKRLEAELCRHRQRGALRLPGPRPYTSSSLSNED